MAIFEEKCFGIQCDNCGKIYEDYSGFSMFADKESGRDNATDDSWVIEMDKCYCPDCYIIDDDDNITIKYEYNIHK